MKNEVIKLIEEVESLSATLDAIKQRLNAMAARLEAEEETVVAVDEAETAMVTAGDDEQEEQESMPESGRDLRGAFTINDRYRFRRELFGNSNAEMTDTINLLSAMSSIEEVEEYLLGDLGWDRANEDVEAFVSIVRRRFSDHPSNLL